MKKEYIVIVEHNNNFRHIEAETDTEQEALFAAHSIKEKTEKKKESSHHFRSKTTITVLKKVLEV